MRFTFVVLAVLALPTPAMAQACIGVPIRPGEVAVFGTIGANDDVRDYGISVIGKRPSPWTFGAATSIQRFPDAQIIDDVSGTAFGVLAAYENYAKTIAQTRGPDLPVSGCATGVLEFRRVRGDAFVIRDLEVSARATALELGYGIGAIPVDTRDYRVAIYTWPRLVVTWAETEVAGERKRESQADPAFSIGLTIHTADVIVIGGEVGIAPGGMAFGLRFGLRVF